MHAKVVFIFTEYVLHYNQPLELNINKRCNIDLDYFKEITVKVRGVFLFVTFWKRNDEKATVEF